MKWALLQAIYLSSVVTDLIKNLSTKPRRNKLRVSAAHMAIMAVLHTESECALNEQKCEALIEAVELRCRIDDVQQ